MITYMKISFSFLFAQAFCSEAQIDATTASKTHSESNSAWNSSGLSYLFF